MRLRPDQLAGHFRKSLAAIYLVYGELMRFAPPLVPGAMRSANA